MDTFTIWMLCIVGMILLYGIFAVYFLLTGVKDSDQKTNQSDDNAAATKTRSNSN